jgi:uncharacterized membrane-anchored protein YjiN (DUF445 family)
MSAQASAAPAPARPRRRLGALSLAAAATGALLAESARRAGVGDPRVVAVLAGSFDAAMIGGLADWFAVSALFREVPIPLLGRHTNLLVRNRREFTRGISDMVQNRWLAPEVLRERLVALSASELLAERLRVPSVRTKAVDALRAVLSRVADDLGSEPVVSLLDRLLRGQLGGIDVGGPLGAWMAGAISRGEHHAVWDLILGSLEPALRDGTLRAVVETKAREAARRYAEGGVMRRVGVGVGEALGAIDYGALADHVVGELSAFVGAARGVPGHPFRAKLDATMLAFAEDLRDGRGDAPRIVAEFRRRLVEEADTRELLRGVLARFEGTLRAELASGTSDLAQTLDRLLEGVVADLDGSPEVRARLDAWVRTVVTDLVASHHGEIGRMVASSIERLSDEDLVREVETKVGDDLQMIRVNGAVVGGLVGAALAALRIALGGV